MRLTKQTGHAIRILTDCAQGERELLKVAELSERLGITKQNVFKIVHILSRAGFLAATRGPSGGVRLAKPANAIRIGDVVRAIEVTHVEIDGEDRAAIGAQRDTGSINAVLDDALAAFVSVLDQHTLDDLAALRRTVPQQKRTATSDVEAAGTGKEARQRRSAAARRY
jgi:Rrf2 family nitric oxide-sensitive transcriptional repressor